MNSLNDPKYYQPKLFETFPEIDFKTVGAARVYYGRAMEELVCGAMELTPIPLNGKYSVNFDAKKGVIFHEIKSVRNSLNPKSVIYDWRINKEKFYRNKLRYVFGLHKATIAKSNSELWDQFENRGVELLVTPAARVHRLALQQPICRIKKQSNGSVGYTRQGYCEGYRCLPINLISEGRSPLYAKSIFFKIYGRKIPIKITYI